VGLKTQYSIIGGCGGTFIVILILLSLPPQNGDEPIPVTPVGEQIISNQTTDDFTNEEGDIPLPQQTNEEKPEELTIKEEIEAEVDPAPRVTSFRSGGGGSNNDDEPSAEDFTYELRLFEGGEESDGSVNLGQSVTAKATTDDPDVDVVTFTWTKDVSDEEETETVSLSVNTADDTFTPNEVGMWIVKADFGNGIIVQESLDISFFVVPESPIGIIALLGASFGTIGAYLYFRRNG
jgi:hypothetical protein